MSPNSWIIDTGATDHIITCLDNFTFYKHASNMYVKLPNIIKIPVVHIGEVRLIEQLILHNFLHVPDFTCNLIFANQLVKTSYYFLLVFPSLCYI